MKESWLDLSQASPRFAIRAAIGFRLTGRHLLLAEFSASTVYFHMNLLGFSSMEASFEFALTSFLERYYLYCTQKAR
jgi:hypothetical protein